MPRRAWIAVVALLATACGSESGNRPPIARAGEDAVAFVGDTVSLDGSASEDPDGDPLGYHWTVLSAPPGSPTGAAGDQALLDFVPADPGGYVLALDVTDGEATHRDFVSVTARRELRVIASAPAAAASPATLTGRAPVVLVFNLPVRRWLVAESVQVLDDQGSPVPGSFTVDDAETAIVFAPSAEWADAALYTVAVDTGLLALDGSPMRGAFTLELAGAAIDLVPPFVQAITPADGASPVSRAASVSVLFSEAVSTTSLATSFSLSPSPPDVEVVLSAGGTRATFTALTGTGAPALLEAGLPHDVTLFATITDLSGNPLDGDGDGTGGDDFTSTFTTASDAPPAPRVLWVSPIQGALDASVKGPVVVAFDEALDPATVDGASLVVTSGGLSAPGTLSFSLGNRAVRFVPSPNLATGARYDLALTGSITGAAGAAIEPYATFFRTGDAPPPSVFSVAPASGRRANTLELTIYGDDFVPGAEVFVLGGGAVADAAVVVDPGRIDVSLTLSPGAQTGLRTVRVANPEPDRKEGFLAGAFRVDRAVPEITSVNPFAGSRRDAAFPVTITGKYFDCSGAPPSVSFGDAGVTVANVSCGASTSENATVLTADVTLTAAATAGLHDVLVRNAGDTADGSGGGLFNVRLERPVITAVTPSIEQGASGTITITGDFFQDLPQVSIEAGSGVLVGNVAFVSPQQVTAMLTVPYSAAVDTYDVTVTNPDLQSAVSTNALDVVTAPPPMVSSATPGFGVTGTTGLAVQVGGAGFQPGAGATTVEFLSGGAPDAGITVTNVTVESKSLVVATVNVGGTARAGLDIRVTNPVGAVATGTGIALFDVTSVQPAISSVAPGSGTQGTNVAFAINGSSFSGSTVLVQNATLDTIPCTGVSVTPTQITCTLNIAAGQALGFYDVTVTNADSGTDTATNVFQVTSATGSPGVSSVTVNGLEAAQLVQGTTRRVHILGSDFNAGATVSVGGSGITVTNVNRLSSTRIDADLTPACGNVTLGSRDVTVTNADGRAGTRADAVFLRHGLMINEVVTQQRTAHGFGSNREIVELFNGSGCTLNLTGYRLDMIDDAITGYEINSGNEAGRLYSTGSSRTSFLPGGYVTIGRPDGNGDNMANAIMLYLIAADGRGIDDVEIGDDRENDGNGDGAVAAGNDGGNGGAADESVGRCANGRDTDHDVNDFYQNEVGGFNMTSTDRASNTSIANTCPPCSDGSDNDGDGWVDFLDNGCSGPNDTTESGGPTTQCNDGLDNDGDLQVDAVDPDCFSGFDNDESQ